MELAHRLTDYIRIDEVGLNVQAPAAKNPPLSDVANAEINQIDTNPLNVSSENFNNTSRPDLHPEMYIDQAHRVTQNLMSAVFGNFNHGCTQDSEMFNDQAHIIQNPLNASLENINNSSIQSIFTNQAHTCAYTTSNAIIQTLQSTLFDNLSPPDSIYQSDRSTFNIKKLLSLPLADLGYTKVFRNSY